MIGKQTKGRGFRGLLDYLESKQETAKLIGGNMSGRNARELAREFGISRQLNPEAERSVYHVSLSLAKDEKLDRKQWCSVAEKYLENMGFDCNQYAVYHHSDTEHDHIHICASRIKLDSGKIISDSWDYLRSEKVIRELEHEYGLTPAPSSREKLARTPSTGQIRRMEREEEEKLSGTSITDPMPIVKQKLQYLIDKHTADSLTMAQLQSRLTDEGVEVKIGTTRTGKSKGISYSLDGQAFSGTKLGAAYTYPGLQKHRGVKLQLTMPEPVLDERREVTEIELLEREAQQKKILADKLIDYAVPIARAVMRHWGEQYGQHSGIRFRASELKKEGNQFIYNSDERGEIFRVEVNRKQGQHGFEYSVLNIGDVQTTDFEHWDKVLNMLIKLEDEIKAEKASQRQSRGLSR